MTRPRIPDDILTAAHDRARARAAGDWREADRLRAVIEGGGWRIVDRGTDFALSPAIPPDSVKDDRVRYASSANVPSRLDEPAVGTATVVVLVEALGTATSTGRLDRLERLVETLAMSSTRPDLVVVAEQSEPALDDRLDRLVARGPGDTGAQTLEVVRTAHGLGFGSLLAIGLRRAGAPVVVGVTADIDVHGEVVEPLIAPLDDTEVSVTGGWGLRTADLRRFDPAPSGDVDAVRLAAMAFRRSDAVDNGPIDEYLRTATWLGPWWSLILRDRGDDRPPGRAIAVPVPADLADTAGSGRSTVERRDFYRYLDRFGYRTDLRTT